ncbi:protein DpdD [Pseudonocardia adelaidensis]|uniref:PglZ domain-containing protein n=1 Tax=Pseudonocardia adelaidensis TaxID=648754 RepID=A0ABP9NU76_9PSEU
MTTVREAVRFAMGDLQRYGTMRDRVEVLVDNQVAAWVSGNSGWLVVPVSRRPGGFYLLSEDREGQRRGGEVLKAFLGPASRVLLEATPLTPETEQIDEALRDAGLVRLSYVNRKSCSREDLLARLEDAVATARSKDSRERPTRPSYVDQLRDLRLALLHQDGRLAEQAWDQLRRVGHLSAENLRFLEIEKLARLERWRELRDLPYFDELLRARRPRAVNEAVLEAVWWTEVAPLAVGGSPADIYAEAALAARYGAVLNTLDVPGTAAGRAMGAVAALAVGDDARFQRLLGAATSDTERGRLQQLAALATPRSAPPQDDIIRLFEDGRYGDVVRTFLDAPDPAGADVAVQAVLEREDDGHAAAVLAAVERFLRDDLLRPHRRLQRDLDELGALVDRGCGGWVEWCARIGRVERWESGAEVLRTQYANWSDLPGLLPAQMNTAAEGIVNAWGNVNQDQIVAGLDVLCHSAATAAGTAFGAEFVDAVLLILAEQQNLTAPVREAYLHLLDQVLASGPSMKRYAELLSRTTELWRRVAAPVAVDWGLQVADLLQNATSPDEAARNVAVTEIVTKSRSFGPRLNLRQRSELEALAAEVGLPAIPLPEPEQGDSHWKQLDGAVVGVYSLLPRAAELLRKRLAPLCAPAAVEGNADTKATSALKAMAGRVDHLIVDTWHAAHAATAGIDGVLPRSEQILPSGRGITAFLQALEQRLRSG